MSPASSGLEVERYIGACLISQNRVKSVEINNKSQNKQFFHVYNQQLPRNHDVWAGGIPLISFANRQKSRKLQDSARQVDDPSSSLARLAVHTQGAPLIVTKTFNHRKNKQNRSTSNGNRHTKVFENSNIKKQNKCGSVNTDTISVTSDESSSSNNSEFCLPRIIKPRKRRKKDRKPLLGRLSSQDGFSTDSTSPEVDNNLSLGLVFPFTFDVYASSNAKSFTQNNEVHTLNDISEAPKLHHAFEDIKDVEDPKDINGNQQTSVCQCRYCDPNSQIWDMDKNGYSPFLTHPSGHWDMRTSSYSSVDCLEHGFSLMSLSDEESLKKVTPSRSSNFLSSRDLEVSTEIITSVNGHRDLEIKFFSSSNLESGKKLL